MAYQATANQVGTPGTPITALDPFWAAGRILDENSTPMDGDRYMCIPPVQQEGVLKAAQGLFQSVHVRSAQQYKRGRMGTMGGFDWIMDQNCRTHTVGLLGGAPTVTARARPDLRCTGAWTAGVAVPLEERRHVHAADGLRSQPGIGRFAPACSRSSWSRRTFRPMARAWLPSPSIRRSPLRARIKPSPTRPPRATPLTITSGTTGSHVPQGIGYHKSAFVHRHGAAAGAARRALCSRPARSGYGRVIRCVSQYNIFTDKFITRCDCLYGGAAQRPEWATRVAS